MDPVTLIFLVVAIIVGLKLRSVLGQSDDDDDRRPMDGYGPRKSNDQRPEQERDGSDNVVTLPTRTTPADQQYQTQQDHEVKKTVNMADQIKKYAPKGSDLERGLQDIVAADKNFEPENFYNGAKTAYEMIVMAFAEGNRKLLKQLLAKEVYEGFLGAIDSREQKNLIVSSSFVGIDAAEIMSAELRVKPYGPHHRQICQLAYHLHS